MNKPPASKSEPATEVELLCLFLNASHDKKLSDQIFSAYYQIVSSQLLFFMEQSLGLSHAVAIEFFHDIMGKQYLRLLTERPEAEMRLYEITATLPPPELDVFSQKSIRIWCDNCEDWTQKAITFHLDNRNIKSRKLDENVKQLNEQQPVLKEESKRLVKRLTENETNQPLAEFFSESAKQIHNALSVLRFPVIAVLYKIAKNKATSYWNKKSTQNEITFDEEWDDGEVTHGVVNEVNSKAYNDWQQQGMPSTVNERKEVIFFLLQTPIRDAKQRLQQATSKQDVQRSYDQLIKAEIKYTRCRIVLDMMKDRHTQEEIAAQLGISRDQVMYLQKQIKELLAPLAPVSRTKLAEKERD